MLPVDLVEHGSQHGIVTFLLATALATDEVVVLLWPLDLVICLTNPGISRQNKPQIHEQMERAVDRRAIERRVLTVSAGVDIAERCVTAAGAYRIEDVPALFGYAMASLAQNVLPSQSFMRHVTTASCKCLRQAALPDHDR